MSELPNVEVKYPGEYIFRTGQALPAKPRADVAISGLIDAPSRFYLSKKELYDWRRGHVRVTADEITLIWGEHESEGRVEVCGDLVLNQDLQNFKINKQNTWSRKAILPNPCYMPPFLWLKIIFDFVCKFKNLMYFCKRNQI
ncbi:MAG TPA: hypothetical protein PKM97_13635 [Bacteroidia bacterium]|nr:hypothetical protein [Bacteroidia bacterium]